MNTTASSPPPPGSLLIAGGGTAGHLLPGIAIAEALVAAGWPKPMIHFVGTRRALDTELVAKAGFGLTQLAGRGLAAAPGRRGRLRLGNISAAAQLGRGTLAGVALVRRVRPAVVLSLGGYAAIPAALGAVAARVPLLVEEQNAAGSAANRVLSRFAKAACVPVTGTGLRREVVTGLPVRPEVVSAGRSSVSATGRAALRERLGWPADATVVVVFGGSLGARRINLACWDALEGGQLAELAQRLSQGAHRAASNGGSSSASSAPPVRLLIHHVVGDRDWDLRPQQEAERGPDAQERTGAAPPGAGTEAQLLAEQGIDYRQIRYDNDLPTALGAADLAVCRAGGSTAAELSITRTPAVMVPLPNAPNDHQRANALALAAEGLAVVVDDGEFDGGRFVAEINRALTERRGAGSGHTPVAPFGRADAAAAIAQLLIQHSRGGPPVEPADDANATGAPGTPDGSRAPAASCSSEGNQGT